MNYTYQLDDEGLYDDYRLANYKYITFDNILENKEITVYQDFKLDKGGIFWDGSYLLIKYFLKHFNQDSQKNIIELGSGTSLPSLVCKSLGYNVISTDLKKMVPFIEKNYSLNFDQDNKMHCYELYWGNQRDIDRINQKMQNKIDYIFASECMYFPEFFDDLINTIDQFSNPNTKILLTGRIRMQERFQDFLEKFQQKFVFQIIEKDEILSIHPNQQIQIIVAQRKE